MYHFKSYEYNLCKDLLKNETCIPRPVDVNEMNRALDHLCAHIG